jgi:hypothetical protein
MGTRMRWQDEDPAHLMRATLGALSGAVRSVADGLSIGVRALRTATGNGLESARAGGGAARELLAACRMLPYPMPAGHPLVGEATFVILSTVDKSDPDRLAAR